MGAPRSGHRPGRDEGPCRRRARHGREARAGMAADRRRLPIGCGRGARRAGRRRANAPPAERRHRLCRRPRLRRSCLLRGKGRRHAAPRSARARRDAVHRLPRRPARLLGVTGGAPHRLLPQPDRHCRRAWPQRPPRNRRRRDDACRSPPRPRLPHRHGGEVAPRPPRALPSHPSRLRRMVWASLFQRHVAPPPGGCAGELSAAAAVRWRADHR